MPAPHQPNTADATRASVAARTRAKHDRWATELRDAGFLVLPPEALPAGRHTVVYTKTDQGVVPELP